MDWRPEKARTGTMVTHLSTFLIGRLGASGTSSLTCLNRGAAGCSRRKGEECLRPGGVTATILELISLRLLTKRPGQTHFSKSN